MAYESNLTSLTYKAGANLTSETAAQYCILKLDGSGNVVLAAAATDAFVGVLQNKPGDTRAATVGISGVSKVKIAGTIAIGDAVTADSAGKGVATTTSGNAILGIALQAGVTGDIIPVRLSGLTKTAV